MTYPSPPPHHAQHQWQQYPQAPKYAPAQAYAYPVYGMPAAGPPRFLPPEYQHVAASDPTVRVLASPGIRLGARLIDLVTQLLLMLAISLVSIALAPADEPEIVAAFAVPLFLASIFLYEPLFIWRKGGTPGKLWLGIQVVRCSDGNYPGFWAAFSRVIVPFFMSLVFLLGLLNVLWLLWDRPLHQCLHDKIASTVVARRS